MTKITAAAAACILALAGGAALGQARSGYLDGADAPDMIRVLPPAPTAGTTRYEADRTVYLATRALKDSPRWALAQNDIDQRAILKDMACSVGVELTPQNAPKLTSLLMKIAPDVGRAVNRPKDHYGRKRPYLIDEGPICADKTPGLAASPDYPSGHTTWGWTVGLILAELAPDRATDILARARSFGESRLVCGVHNLSAVEEGRTTASALVAALHGSADFRADLDAARAEVARARAAGPAPDAASCAAEAELVAKPLF
ncbi:phosphatase PAP2 family protein [Phenylobacterium sp.]|uniref:acid phosphatase n=1 Tax=Phenylobacterium sp. TaxID=1871053 RepID=UPI0035AE4216